MDEEFDNDKADSISCGTAAKGGAVKIYFDYDNETEERILAKANFCHELAQKLSLKKKNYPDGGW